MPWGIFDDGAINHPAVMSATLEERGAWWTIVMWAAQQILATDRKVPKFVAVSLGGAANVKRLVRLGLLIESGDRYNLPRSLVPLRSAAKIRAARKANSDRQKRWRARRTP